VKQSKDMTEIFGKAKIILQILIVSFIHNLTLNLNFISKKITLSTILFSIIKTLWKYFFQFIQDFDPFVGLATAFRKNQLLKFLLIFNNYYHFFKYFLERYIFKR
jgi:hypothetical protein